MNEPNTITTVQKAALERELRYLRTTRSRELDAMLAEARELEDAEAYAAALHEQDRSRRRMEELEAILAHASVAESPRLPDAFVAELTARAEACGLSSAQAEAYGKYCREGYALGEEAALGVFPSAECFQTLAEAVRILSAKSENWDLSGEMTARLLQTPSGQWQRAQKAMTVCFGCSDDAVTAVFREDVNWLFVTADSVSDFAAYLKHLFSGEEAWRVYQNAVFVGLDTTRSWFGAVRDILGQDAGLEMLRPAGDFCWPFSPYCPDPAGFLVYMKRFTLTPGQLRAALQEAPQLLTLYEERRSPACLYDQAQLDTLICGLLQGATEGFGK